ncbi:tyrosine-type recombinase/integrase [Rhodobacterales bacterium HKCCA1058]|nr:tyrosine-type recombinase/integrase [Rhodobacterales bacterium HKCCA1058]
MPKFLMQQRSGWYAVLEIPKELRGHFGKTRFKQSLKTDSLSQAKVRLWPIVAEWKVAIALARQECPSSRVDTYDERPFAFFTSASPPSQSYKSLTQLTSFKTAEYVDEYLEGAAKSERPKTIDMKRKVLMEWCKKFQVENDITNRKLISWVEDDLIKGRSLSVATCRRIISTVKSYCNHLQKYHDVDTANAFRNIALTNRKSQSSGLKRKGFTPSDYQRLVAACTSDTQLRQLIELAAYSGCRIEELCSLRTDQVHTTHFDILDAKTAAGCRVVPLHSRLRPLVAELKAISMDEYLLSGLSFNKYGNRSNAIGKRFGRLKQRCGYNPSYVFHSFRKGVATQLENAHIPEVVAARLLGHEIHTMSYGTYSDGLGISSLKAAIEVVNWETAP